jgi:hypothetical protein
VNEYSSPIVSATLSTTGTRGCAMPKSAKVNLVEAVPVTYRALRVLAAGGPAGHPRTM